MYSYIDDYLLYFKSTTRENQSNVRWSQHPNIKLVRQLGTSVLFLDLFIENKNGTLVASVFHKRAAKPYIVPFKSDHPWKVFKNVIDGTLMRAVRYSSALSAFHD
jgi:hypothetical protein